MTNNDIKDKGLFSNRITWVMRDEPLSDELLDELVKAIK